MTASPDPRLAVRRIRSDEWAAVRALRLESTSDPDAGIAFLETPEQVAARSDDFWRERTHTAATSETAAQFVAAVDDVWVGSLSVLIRATGQKDHTGRFVDDRRADVVGVYVNPAHRGSGAVDVLLAAAAEWAASLGLDRICLDVHRDNQRAQGAYRRAGFAPTGETFSSSIGPEIVMARPLP
ncbi:GNAT family N-acetyltransferase [Microbacterium sp. QXD-8]|uniref:GNAT family N-acetyltransferase n=1 Tax=Microbacterium psychrotolerans TaxID=3068321 RepID=A0ABU0YZQ6_9MICO|nr:GNAT family N-acetyltransferase [Microbacterium sp. QXD-8]MDQ7877817.1 GNAT family N-acetyltransferase [Microbacterium sp. QXD-8]